MKISIAILAAALLLAACYWVSRPCYEFHIANNAIIWRCDRQTGTVSWAIPSEKCVWHTVENMPKEQVPEWAETTAPASTNSTGTAKGDIFDQVAAETPAAKGDIFDQVATNADRFEIVQPAKTNTP